MISVQSKTMSCPVGPGATAAPAAGGAPPPLLPASDASEHLDVGSALSQLMVLTSAINEAQMKGNQAQATLAGNARRDATEKRIKAMEAAIEAAKKAAEEQSSGGFFDIITDNIGVTGLVGLVTGQFYLVAQDVAAHKAGVAGDSFDLADATALYAGPLALALEQGAKKALPEDLAKSIEDLGAVKDDDVRLANKLALMIVMAQAAVAATVASGGTSAPAIVGLVGIGISTTTQVLQETGALKAVLGDKAAYFAMGATILGAGLTLGSSFAMAGNSATEVTRVMAVVDRAKTVAQSVHGINQGVHNLIAADYQHDADNFKIESKVQKNAMEAMERIIDAVIDDAKAAKDSAQRTTEILQGTMQNANQAMLTAGSMRV